MRADRNKYFSLADTSLSGVLWRGCGQKIRFGDKEEEERKRCM